MAAILPMSHDTLDRIPAAFHGADASSSRVAYPALSEDQQRAIASAALANVASSSSDSSQNSNNAERYARPSPLVAGAVNGTRASWLANAPVTQPAPFANMHDATSMSQLSRPYTPEQQIYGAGNSSTSPDSNESAQLKSGAKRTASGAVKMASNGVVRADLGQYGTSRGHIRAKSSSRAAEISSQLKTRLAYAMVKVNHGWENQSLEQLEHISRISTPSVTSPTSTSPRRRRFSLHSEYDDRFITSPEVHYSPNQYSPRFMQQPTALRYSPVVPDSTSTFHPMNGPTLAPAAPIAPGRSHRRSLSSKAPPSLTTRGLGPSDPYSQPTTPRRQGILRMPSQQAEKDALDSLLFMASPNNSSNLKYTDNSAGPSPLRTEFPASAKRVVFEN